MATREEIELVLVAIVISAVVSYAVYFLFVIAKELINLAKLEGVSFAQFLMRIWKRIIESRNEKT